MKTIVIFQGGGALGAFAAGTWRALVPRLQEADMELVGLAGASIGGLNAALIAAHHQDPDWGAGALEGWWRNRLATPSWPFVPPAWGLPLAPTTGDTSSWNGLLTGLLAGTRGLYRAAPERLNLLGALQRIHWPLFERSPMYDTLAEAVGEYDSRGSAAPWLAVAAVDVLEGQLRLFDSDAGPVTPTHLAASAALPLLFDPVEIEGRAYWDGEVCADSIVPAALQGLRDRGRAAPGEDLLLVTVEPVSPRARALPQSSVEIVHRVLELLLMRKLSRVDASRHGATRHLHVSREQLPHELVSGQFDYSPARLDALIEQGERAAAEAWHAFGAG